jgi:hypothetical protein
LYTIFGEKQKEITKRKNFNAQGYKGIRRPGCVAVFVRDSVVCSFLE